MKRIFGVGADMVEEWIRGRRLRWMVAVPSAIATLLVAFGLWKNLAVLVNATLVCTSVFLGLVVIGMAIARRYMRRQIIQREKVVARYATAIFRAQEANPGYFKILKWAEEQDVRKAGDTTIVRDITIQAGDLSIPAVWVRASRSSSQYLSSAIRDKINVVARYINDDGTEGTRLVTTFDWESEKGIRITVFFDHDLDAHAQARVRVTILWPRYSADLLEGESTKEYWLFHRAIDELHAVTEYSRAFAPNGIKVTTLPGSPAPSIQKGGASGSSSVTLLVSDLSPHHEYGYHVEVV